MHYEICEYYILDEHTRPPDVLLISTIVWEKLSPEFQQVLQDAADESVEYERQLWAEQEKEDLRIVEEAGVTVTYPDKQPFRDAVRPLWAEFEGTEIGELAQKIIEVQ
jgi:TRAP-type C4-dicarboxylate transport system substrate-binding protein